MTSALPPTYAASASPTEPHRTRPAGRTAAPLPPLAWAAAVAGTVAVLLAGWAMLLP